MLGAVKDSIVQGFQWATREGPLCDERKLEKIITCSHQSDFEGHKCKFITERFITNTQ